MKLTVTHNVCSSGSITITTLPYEIVKKYNDADYHHPACRVATRCFLPVSLYYQNFLARRLKSQKIQHPSVIIEIPKLIHKTFLLHTSIA